MVHPYFPMIELYGSVAKEIIRYYGCSSDSGLANLLEWDSDAVNNPLFWNIKVYLKK